MDFDVCGVITKKSGSYNSDFLDLTNFCEDNRIEYIYSINSKEKSTLDFIRKKNPDVIYCFGWSHILIKEILNIPRLGVIGFHPAKLPYNKGRHPLIWALVLGLDTTASSFFNIDEGVDTGDLVSQVDVNINYNDDARSLYDKVMQTAKKQVFEITRDLITGNIKRYSQDHSKGNFWRKRNYQDGKIDFRMTSASIRNLIRALTRPYPGAHFVYENNDYRVWSSELMKDKKGAYIYIEPGKIIDVYSKTSFLAKTGDGLIIFTETDEIDLKIGDYL